MTNNYVYVLDGKAYINLTNKCRNACAFCIRNTGDGVAGTPLWLDKEPTATDVMTAFDALAPCADKEVVFCGYGEPTENLDALKACAAQLKARGYTTRLNTNGLGSLAAGRDISGELTDIDTVSVSLNAGSAERYYEITNSAYGLDAFPALVEFAQACKARGITTVFTVVDVIGDDQINKCKTLCAKLDIPLRVRKYVGDNYEG